MQSANILLDSKGQPKLADFGTARWGTSVEDGQMAATGGGDANYANVTQNVAGTQGFMPPE